MLVAEGVERSIDVEADGTFRAPRVPRRAGQAELRAPEFEARTVEWPGGDDRDEIDVGEIRLW